MEGMCVRLILENGQRDALVAALEPVVAEMASAEAIGDFALVDALDARFHVIVVDQSDHQRLKRIWQSAHPVVWTAAIPALRAPVREPVLTDKHRRLLRAIATQSAQEAQEAMIVHIREGEYDAIHNVSHDATPSVALTD